jgi:MFS family permease
MVSTVLIFAIFSALLSGLSYGLVSVAFPFLLYEVNVAFWQFGLAESVSMGLTSLVLFKTIKVRLKMYAVMSVIALVVARFLIATSLNPFQILPAYILAYISNTMYNVVIASAVLDSVRRYRATALGLISSIRFIVSVFSPMAGALTVSFLGIRETLTICAFMAFLYLPLAFGFAKAPERERIGAKQLFRQYRYACLFALLMSLGGFPGSMYMVFEGMLGVYVGEFPAWVIGTYVSIESLLIIVGTPLAGFITDVIRRKFLIPVINDILNIPYAVTLIYGSLSKNLLLYLFTPVPDALMSAATTASMSILKEFKTPTKELIAFYNAFGHLSAMTGVIIAGFLFNFGGIYTTLIVIIIVSLILIMMDILILPKLYNKIFVNMVSHKAHH